jgi:hypothetical protein
MREYQCCPGSTSDTTRPATYSYQQLNAATQPSLQYQDHCPHISGNKSGKYVWAAFFGRALAGKIAAQF